MFPFDSYIEAKINKGEAFMAVDTFDNCLGVIAFSKGNNCITFFGITHTTDFQEVGDVLLHYALDCLDKTKPIFINEIASSSPWTKQHGKLYLSCGFTFSSRFLKTVSL